MLKSTRYFAQILVVVIQFLSLTSMVFSNKPELNEPLSLVDSGGNGQNKQFLYTSLNHGLEVKIGSEPSFEVSSAVNDFALHTNKHLNSSIFFDTKFLRNPKAVRDWHLKNKPCKKNVGKLIKVMTADGHAIPCTFFDRGSSVLTIVGEGFTNEREVMTPFVDMFDTDIVLFDFRGQGYEQFSLFNYDTWCVDLAKVTFGMDARVATLGEVEEEDVFAVVDFFKNSNGKQYEQVNGVSVCYSSFIFLKAEAIWNKRHQQQLFSKIVVDGCWDSLDNVVQKIRKDPYLILVPQTGGWNNHWLFKQEPAQEALDFLARYIFGLQFDHTVKLTDYLSSINQTPVLFFYGKDDLMVNRSEFEALWQAFSSPHKVGVVTNNPHVINHLKQKEMYKLVCELFFENSLPVFKELMQNSNALKMHYANKILSLK